MDGSEIGRGRCFVRCIGARDRDNVAPVSGPIAVVDIGTISTRLSVLGQSGIEVREAYLFAGGVGHPSLGLQLGRQRFRDEREWWYDDRLDAIRVKTPDPEFDSMVNVWNAYNALITYTWSRSASLIYNGERDGLGYRDTVQDFLGVTPLLGADLRERLELMLTGQVASGGAISLIRSNVI